MLSVGVLRAMVEVVGPTFQTMIHDSAGRLFNISALPERFAVQVRCPTASQQPQTQGLRGCVCVALCSHLQFCAAAAAHKIRAAKDQVACQGGAALGVIGAAVAASNFLGQYLY